MRSRRHRPTHGRGAGLALACASVLAACEGPNTDSFRRDGGAAPDPTGIIEGTVLYVGPRPRCTDDRATVVGAVVLTLFRYDNPPPPAGTASSALSLLTIPGSSLFAASDCMPETPTAEDLRPIMRSAPFVWPEISLGREPCAVDEDGSRECPGVSYMVRGFYDYDGDFNPFFGVRNLPTAGDVGGGAFVSTAANPPVPREIRFGHIEDRANGEVVSGIAVTLGAVVNTERPLFEVIDDEDNHDAMDSAATLPGGTDPVVRENALWDLTRMRFRGIVGPMQTEPSEAWTRALTAAGIDTSLFRFGEPQYGFYVKPVDANNDGMGDPHPILGTAGIGYFTPIIVLRRARNAIEQRLGLPDVSFVATIRPTVQRGLPYLIPREQMYEFDVVVPPVAVMFTNPDLPQICRMPILPPGNTVETYERIWVDCQDLPTGNYDVNVLAGVAGGRATQEHPRCMEACLADGSDMATCMGQCDFTTPLVTESGWTIQGGNFSSQAWSIPNELGCPDLLYRPTALNQLDPPGADGTLPACDARGVPPEGSVLLERQGRAATWAVVDVGTPFDVDPASAATTPGHGIAACMMAMSAVSGMVEPVQYMDPPSPDCCPPRLDPFCGLPLCPLRDASTEVPAEPLANLASAYAYPEAVVPARDGTRLTREIRVPGVDYVVNDDGTIRPLCTPFLMPVACCQAAERRRTGG